MISSIHPQSQISCPKPSPPHVYGHRHLLCLDAEFLHAHKTSSAIPGIRNLVVHHSISPKEFHRVRFTGRFPDKTHSRSRILRASESRLSILSSSMPIQPVGSASFYPIKGLIFFFNSDNRQLLGNRIAKFAAEVAVASVIIFGSLVGFTWSAQQSVVLQVLPHFLGFLGTLALILIETALPVSLIFYKRKERVQEKLFADVLNIQGIQVGPVSADEREWIDQQVEYRKSELQAQPPSFLKTITDPESLNSRPLVKYFVTLPLNFIPVAGQAAFCWLNAMDTGASLHHYYYSKIKKYSGEEEAAVIHYMKDQYQQFGLTATALGLIPGFDILLVLTNSVGAALWAADIENSEVRPFKITEEQEDQRV